jgi:hypothetical protein
MHRFLLLVIVGVTASGSAFADDPFHLRGTYAFTGMSACIQDSASLGFNPDFTPKGPTAFFNFTATGTRTFNGDGTGTVNGTSVTVDAPPNASGSSATFTFLFTYTVDDSDMLSTTMVPGSFSGSVLTGPRAGQTYVNAVPVQTGQIGENARSIVISEPAPAVETVTFSNGDNVARVCNRSRVLIITRHDNHRSIGRKRRVRPRRFCFEPQNVIGEKLAARCRARYALPHGTLRLYRRAI